MERRVLLSIEETGEPVTPSDIAKITGLSTNVVRSLLGRLVQKDCVNKIGRGEYALFNPLFGAYIKGLV